ncbi:hypothetical protein KDA_59490 [Dictyobacter alpinus]|uniref:4Fe-4S ferredoxin-type domain-containing protein n=1 Tax=Dictyobacter alpinus TaxID=2014873 RepID=A0A402BGG3_9CHLR|nr:AAA family ATPase [Dictyobacter alpinus]GCE30465.1 hypothetical protein KDA_59490 [Dictyobacter alpinus]
MTTKDIKEQRIAFAPSANNVLQGAQREAFHMHATTYHPEHLFLSILRLEDELDENIFSLLGMDIRVLRGMAVEVVGNVLPESELKHEIHPSKEAQECLDWAIAFAKQRHSPKLRSDHILLSVLRHPQVQPLLLLMFSPEDVIPSYLTEESGAAYTNAMDQLIQIKIREHKRLGKHVSNLPMVTCERPTVTFKDVLGANAAKQELRELVAYLRRPQLYQRSRTTALEETLLVGHPCTERTLLVHGIAGEAVVSLVSLSLSKLVNLMNALAVNMVDAEDLVWLEHEYPAFLRDNLTQTARNLLHSTFELAKTWSPCLLFIEDLDALLRLESKEHRMALQRQLLVELDALDWQKPIAVIATVYKPELLDPELMEVGHFNRRVVLSESYAIHPAAQTKLCLSCKHEVLANWHYCVYCGASLVKACPHCGAPHVEVEGARYCFSCGSDVWSQA